MAASLTPDGGSAIPLGDIRTESSILNTNLIVKSLPLTASNSNFKAILDFMGKQTIVTIEGVYADTAANIRDLFILPMRAWADVGTPVPASFVDSFGNAAVKVQCESFQYTYDVESITMIEYTLTLMIVGN